MYRKEDEEDLRGEIFQLKKQLAQLFSENHLLKVKVRKLTSEVTKKDKQMDSMLDPRKSIFDARKVIYERSASFILSMKEQNEELTELVHQKDVYIKRLENKLQIMKLYSHQNVNKSRPQTKPNHKNNSGLREAESTLIKEMGLDLDAKKGEFYNQYKNLSKNSLVSIIENLKSNRFSPQSSRKSSPESDLDRIELACESPHEEIQQLHLHFMEMLSEVEHLKKTLNQLQNEQEKTESALKHKDTNITKLTKQIKSLKRPKSDEIVARLYSGRSCPKPGKKSAKKAHKGTQFEEGEPNSTICVYIERNGRKEDDGERESPAKFEKSDDEN